MKHSFLKDLLISNVELFKKENQNNPFIDNVIIPAYEWIESGKVESGAIIDKYVQSELKFQYHVSHFVFSSALLYKLTNKKKYYNNTLESIKYLLQLDDATKNPSSFNAIPLLLSLLVVEEENIKSSLVNFISGLDLYPPLNSSPKRSNNLYVFKGLSHILRANLIHCELSREDNRLGKEIIVDYLLNWQLTDGFFYDTPFENNNKNGTPNTTYHSTMWMLLTISALFFKNDSLIDRSRMAFQAIESVTSPSGEMSYGRSNNAIFGYASAILASSIHAVLEPNDKKRFLDYRQKLMTVFLTNQAEDGHFYIVPNSIEDKRCGFDHYMFVSVYNSYATSLLLLSHLIIPFKIK
jgi:hypothetical protein